MVSYTTYTRIGFRVAEEKGAQFDGIDDGGRFISELAALWQDEKSELKQMTEEQAERRLNEVVTA